MFNKKYHKDVDGETIESPFDLSIAESFKCTFESKWLPDYPNDFKPVLHKRHVDDIFPLLMCLWFQTYPFL